jgi:hypothetical protein|tara:strand:- start:331 stop:633 length:303 start_codon:yes stop_codon:yes gene_type:complete
MMEKRFSLLALGLAVVVAVVLGAVSGAAYVADSKVANVADTVLEFQTEVDSLKAVYGDKVGAIFDLVLDEKVVELLKDVDSKTLAACSDCARTAGNQRSR